MLNSSKTLLRMKEGEIIRLKQKLLNADQFNKNYNFQEEQISQITNGLHHNNSNISNRTENINIKPKNFLPQIKSPTVQKFDSVMHPKSTKLQNKINVDVELSGGARDIVNNDIDYGIKNSKNSKNELKKVKRTFYDEEITNINDIVQQSIDALKRNNDSSSEKINIKQQKPSPLPYKNSPYPTLDLSHYTKHDDSGIIGEVLFGDNNQSKSPTNETEISQIENTMERQKKKKVNINNPFDPNNTDIIDYNKIKIPMVKNSSICRFN